MTSEPIFSFVYDRTTADAAFHGIGIRELVLSLIAGITPDPGCEGCTIYEGESPLEAGTVCIGTSGPGADAIQLRLLEAFEKQGVRIVSVYEGGPEPRTKIAQAQGEVWITPDR